jgi:hypothetical protein
LFPTTLASPLPQLWRSKDTCDVAAGWALISDEPRLASDRVNPHNLFHRGLATQARDVLTLFGPAGLHDAHIPSNATRDNALLSSLVSLCFVGSATDRFRLGVYSSACPVIRNTAATKPAAAPICRPWLRTRKLRKLMEGLAVKWLQLALDLEKARAFLEANKDD